MSICCCRIMLDPCGILLVMNVLYVHYAYWYVVRIIPCLGNDVCCWILLFYGGDCLESDICFLGLLPIHSIHRICKQNLCILIICKLYILCDSMNTYLHEQPNTQQTTFFPQWLKADYQQNGGYVCTWNEWTSLPQPRRG